MNILENLRAIINICNVTQSELASRLNKTQQYVSYKLMNLQTFKIVELEKWLDALGVELNVTFSLPNGVKLST